MENNAPYILEETEDFAVVFKPPKMHSAPGKNSEDTLFDWLAANSPPVFDLMHRLDFETHGLVLAAKTLQSFEFFRDLQEKGEFIKEYSAICVNTLNSVSNNPTPPNNNSSIPHSSFLTPNSILGFPPPPVLANLDPSADRPLIIESFFRPFGPGRKQVRPVIDDGKKHKETAKDRGGYYRTEITGITGNVFTVRIRRGFRHQIRCHLCWAGFPILNDPLYGAASATGELALRAHALFFTDPRGKVHEYRIQSMLDKPHV